MINVRIYCIKKHQDYDRVYNVIHETLEELALDFYIERIDKPEVLYRQHIIYQPHIVINREVVFARSCPSREEIIAILQRMKLLK